MIKFLFYHYGEGEKLISIQDTIDLMRSGVLQCAESQEEKDKLAEFIDNPDNRDFIEYMHLLSSGYDGWVKLSSGNTEYVKQPMGSPEQVGTALKTISSRIEENRNENL